MQTSETIVCESAAPLNGIAIEGAAPLETGNVIDDDQPGILIKDCTIIEGDRWGSSGYYPGDALERSVPKNIFHEDLQVFLDHEDPDKDSAGKLMGFLASDAHFVTEDGKPKLKSDVRFYATGVYNADWVKERMKHLGLSIRAGITFENGTRGGRSGKIVTDFTRAISVDVVARAGAGGKFGSIKESEAQISAEEEGKGIVPLTKEELAEIGQTAGVAAATAVAEALKQPFADLGNIIKESAKPTFKEFKPAELAAEIAKVKLTDAGATRVWAAFEAKGDVEKALSDEVAHEKQVLEAAKGRPDAHVTEGGAAGTATESDVPAGWGVIAKEGA